MRTLQFIIPQMVQWINHRLALSGRITQLFSGMSGANRTVFLAGIGMAIALSGAGCALRNPKPCVVAAVETGIGSYYGQTMRSVGRTASGEQFAASKMTAAHPTLPFGSMVEVTNLRNGKSVVVRINDRGPFVKGRIIDLSRGAAKKIGMLSCGPAPVKVAPVNPPGDAEEGNTRADGGRFEKLRKALAGRRSSGRISKA